MAKSGMEFTAAECPKCFGVGWLVWRRAGADGARESVPCDECGGAGKIPVRLARDDARRFARIPLSVKIFIAALFASGVVVTLFELLRGKP